MEKKYPQVRFTTWGARRKVYLYEDYLSLETSGFLGVSDETGQAYFDEIHYIFRYRKTDWSMLALALVSSILVVIGLALLSANDPGATYVGLAIGGVGGLMMLFSLYRLFFVKRLMVKVASPRGVVDFRAEKKPSFVEDLISRVSVVAAVQSAPEPPPVAPPPGPT